MNKIIAEVLVEAISLGYVGIYIPKAINYLIKGMGWKDHKGENATSK